MLTSTEQASENAPRVVSPSVQSCLSAHYANRSNRSDRSERSSRVRIVSDRCGRSGRSRRSWASNFRYRRAAFLSPPAKQVPLKLRDGLKSAIGQAAESCGFVGLEVANAIPSSAAISVSSADAREKSRKFANTGGLNRPKPSATLRSRNPPHPGSRSGVEISSHGSMFGGFHTSISVHAIRCQDSRSSNRRTATRQ